jgi:hypothetical protein
MFSQRLYDITAPMQLSGLDRFHVQSADATATMKQQRFFSTNTSATGLRAAIP